MSSKDRLFEMMGKLDPNFKPRLNEDVYNDAGEPNMTHSQARDYTEPAEPEYNDNSPDGVSDFNSITKELENVFDTILYNVEDGHKDFQSKNHDIMLYGDNGKLELYIDTEKKYENYFDDVNIEELVELIKPYENTILKGHEAERGMDSISSDAADGRDYARHERSSLEKY